MIFFTSDLHFGHEKILSDFSVRNFSSLDEMNGTIIENINKCVKPNDALWNLGDFCWTNNPGYFKQSIKCKNHNLIIGNHDNAKTKRCFSTAQDVKMLKTDIGKIFLSHYPHFYWDGSHHGVMHLYGHLHYYREDLMDSVMPDRRAMDVGIDAAFHRFGEYRPFSLDDVQDILGERKGHHDLDYERAMEIEWEEQGIK